MAAQIASVEGAKEAERQRPPPFLCLLIGGPGSGKTMLGSGLQKAFPGLCHASGGDLARLATSDEARAKSPLLNSISRQLSDKRRRKIAARRLVEVVTSVLADTLRSNAGLCGLIVDGVRVTDVESFEQALGNPIACVLRIDCQRETMLQRLQGRTSRQGDERLGLSDTTDDVGRIDAYLQRAADEEALLRTHFSAGAIHLVDGSQSPDACLQSAKEALQQAAQAAGQESSRALQCAESCAVHLPETDWFSQLLATVLKLDTEVHPDGRPRTKLPSSASILTAEGA